MPISPQSDSMLHKPDDYGFDSIFGALIWPHGMKFFEEILEVIKLSSKQIISINKFKVSDMKRLVKDVYSNDYAPYEHLENKSKYLLQFSGDVACIFFQIPQRTHITLGEGRFKHEECEEIRNLKTKIRTEFNPRSSTGIATHDHVIHFTDNFFQTIDLHKKISAFRQLPALNLIPERGYMGWPQHVDFNSVVIEKQPLDKLKIRLVHCLSENRDTWSFTIKSLQETPHYELCRGNTTPYKQYISQALGLGITEYRSVDDYRSKIGNWLSGNITEFTITALENSECLAIVDGAHRAAFMKYMGLKDCIVQVYRRQNT
jgi:hypothetical protein